MLCSRSHSFTSSTRTSRDIATSIFLKCSAWVSWREVKR